VYHIYMYLFWGTINKDEYKVTCGIGISRLTTY